MTKENVSKNGAFKIGVPDQPTGADQFFDQGYRAGSAGSCFPLKRLKNSLRSEITPIDAVEILNGYIGGLSDRLGQLGVKPEDIGLIMPLEHVFIEDIGILGLNAGIQRQAPFIPPYEGVGSGQNTPGAHFLDGYRIGWVIAAVKKYGIIPCADAIPVTPELFKLYKMAEKGDFSEIDYKQKHEDSAEQAARLRERKNLPHGEISQLIAGERKEEITRAVLAFGIDRWLGANGISVIKSDILLSLNPEVRRGFAKEVNKSKDKQGKKSPQSEAFQRGIVFAKRILYIEKLWQKKINETSL